MWLPPPKKKSKNRGENVYVGGYVGGFIVILTQLEELYLSKMGPAAEKKLFGK